MSDAKIVDHLYEFIKQDVDPNTVASVKSRVNEDINKKATVRPDDIEKLNIIKESELTETQKKFVGDLQIINIDKYDLLDPLPEGIIDSEFIIKDGINEYYISTMGNNYITHAAKLERDSKTINENKDTEKHAYNLGFEAGQKGLAKFSGIIGMEDKELKKYEDGYNEGKNKKEKTDEGIVPLETDTEAEQVKKLVEDETTADVAEEKKEEKKEEEVKEEKKTTDTVEGKVPAKPDMDSEEDMKKALLEKEVNEYVIFDELKAIVWLDENSDPKVFKSIEEATKFATDNKVEKFNIVEAKKKSNKKADEKEDKKEKVKEATEVDVEIKADVEKEKAEDEKADKKEDEKEEVKKDKESNEDSIEEKKYNDLAEKAIVTAHLKNKSDLTEKEKAFVAEQESIVLTVDDRVKILEIVKKIKNK